MRRYFNLLFAFLLVLLVPALAAAHSGTGHCADCHIMHASQDGSTSTPQKQLLKYNCLGCHLGRANLSNGRADSATGIVAPQVDDSATSLAGGYFDPLGADAIQHNVSDIPSLSLDLAFSVIPGDGAIYDADSQVGCTLCHDLALGHSAADAVKDGTATSSYRMLKGTPSGTNVYVKGTGDANYEAGATSATAYDAASMNIFCASCHGVFHDVANTDSNGDGSGAWIRHPTDVTTTSYGDDYAGTDKAVPVGDKGVTNQVMCISCHRPHGGAFNDILRFNYSGVNNKAGDVTQSLGCETCHGIY